ncbi:MAG: ribosome-associated translation inhibitor RaiA [Candidatus Moranbacteria bacterium]|nr:ribosome-associated translation inhibitor RaiA [Candidatus Moranbacteria bacterium]
MQINYYFHSLISKKEKEQAKSYLEEKVSVWDKYFNRSTFPPKVAFEMEFLVRKKHYRTEIQLECSLGRIIASAKKHTLFEGIDAVADEVKRQIIRQKSKLLTLRRRGALSLKKKFTVHRGARFRKAKISD